MSVRSTNVYEEQGELGCVLVVLNEVALGVYDPEDPNMNGECEPSFQGKRREVFRSVIMPAEHTQR